jgi:hypothetical protein
MPTIGQSEPMKYHARLTTVGERDLISINLTRDELFYDIAIPFLYGQVTDIPLNDQGIRRMRLINMRSVLQLTLYQTTEVIEDLAMWNVHEEQIKDYTRELFLEIRKLISPVRIKSLLEKIYSATKNQAFIIMQYDDNVLDSAYEGVVKPVFKEFGIEAIRIDELHSSGKISDEILDKIAESKIIYADLSGQRPNCYYEAGFSYGLGKEMILTVRESEMQNIHFDLIGNRFIRWKTEAQLRSQLRTRLDALKADGVLGARVNYGSPLRGFTAASASKFPE